ncbi:MAG: pyrimidine dimer DNA glycosylase/endonuclease V [Syntrophomonas sp.]
MRLWSIHPKYLDAAGLVALWRESLLAQKVLQEETTGYKNHPQLIRFKKHPYPQMAIASYLNGVWIEATQRGYSFNREKIGAGFTELKILVTRGQLDYEFTWLCQKLQRRDPVKCQQIVTIPVIECHPLFRIMPGEIECWERRNNLPNS